MKHTGVGGWLEEKSGQKSRGEGRKRQEDQGETFCVRNWNPRTMREVEEGGEG